MSGTNRALYGGADNRVLSSPSTGRAIYAAVQTPTHIHFTGGFAIPTWSAASWGRSASPWVLATDGAGGWYWTPSYVWNGTNCNGGGYIYLTKTSGVWSARFGCYFYGDLYNYYGQSQSEVLYQHSGSIFGTYEFVSYTQVNVVERYGPITNAVTGISID